MRTSPTLLSLAIDTAVFNFSTISDLSFLPEHILLELFVRTLRAGKLTEKILRLFVASGKDEILSLIRDLKIQVVLTPVLPTRTTKMAQVSVREDEVDVVIGALHSDLTSFMEHWRPIFSQYHLIVVQDPDLKEDLKVAPGFNLHIYTKSDIERLLGSSTKALAFSGYSCRYFGYLMSRKKYIISVDDDCVPAKDGQGNLTDAVAQHIINLSTPATPFFFNTLYDPYCKGTDFVRGYPFSLRNGVQCTMSSGLWLNLADLDAPTQALKAEQRNSKYVNAVLTVPTGTLFPASGVNVAFNRELVGPALLPAFRLSKEGKFRWETVEDLWTGLCVKVISDHLGFGVKTGLPYVWRNDRGDAVESLKKEWEGVKLMEEVVPFFQSLKFSQAAVKAEDCVIELAAAVEKQLGGLDPAFGRAAEAMLEWIKLWKSAA